MREMHSPNNRTSTCCTFETPLGWIAIFVEDDVVCRLTMGHSSSSDALKAIFPAGGSSAPCVEPEGPLVERLRACADGRAEDFSDVLVDTSYLTPLGQAVFDRCRQIPHGHTRTYGELAADVGRPGAARAVGQFMASNRTPILVPCHRVVGAGGRLGGFTAPGGVDLKKRLLEIEAASAE